MTTLRQIALNAVLIVTFAGIFFILLTPFLAQTQFDSAEKLIAKYLWKDAEAKFELAIKIDPYDSRYPARLGEFLFTQSGNKHNKIQLLNKAEKYYERASALNPECAEYYTKLGQIKLSAFLEETSKTEFIKYAFANFRKAIEDDPNGFNTAYAVGYSGLALWKYLDESERAIVVGRLKFSLRQRPWYSEYVYPRVIEKTGDAQLLGSGK